MMEGNIEKEAERSEPKFEWDYLGRLPLDIKLDAFLVARGMISGSQFLDQRRTRVLKKLNEYPEVTGGRARSIILSRIENEEGGRADVYATKIDVVGREKGILLAPEDRFQTRKRHLKLTPEEVYKTLTRDNGLFFVLDKR